MVQERPTMGNGEFQLWIGRLLVRFRQATPAFTQWQRMLLELIMETVMTTFNENSPLSIERCKFCGMRKHFSILVCLFFVLVTPREHRMAARKNFQFHCFFDARSHVRLLSLLNNVYVYRDAPRGSTSDLYNVVVWSGLAIRGPRISLAELCSPITKHVYWQHFTA